MVLIVLLLHNKAYDPQAAHTPADKKLFAWHPIAILAAAVVQVSTKVGFVQAVHNPLFKKYP